MPLAVANRQLPIANCQPLGIDSGQLNAHNLPVPFSDFIRGKSAS
jgi:hypothetical protein